MNWLLDKLGGLMNQLLDRHHFKDFIEQSAVFQ